MGTIATPAPTQAAFDPEYLSFQPPAVKQLMEMPWGVAKQEQAQKLTNEGYVIDVTIMVWGWSAWWTTNNRIALGYTWIPSNGMPPIQIAPGLVQGSTPPYDAAIMPAGAIPVTWAITPNMFPAPKGAQA